VWLQHVRDKIDATLMAISRENLASTYSRCCIAVSPRTEQLKEIRRLADFDPFQDIDCEASSDYEAITCTPEQTLTILNQLDEPEFILTLVIAATDLSISEALGLQWADVEYDRKRIVVRRS
jgi:hypothetical protein